MIRLLRARWRDTFRTQAGDRPRITWPLVRRVMRYARPYRWQIGALLVMILISTALGLLQPLIFRDLIDNTLPQKDLGRLNILALGLLALPLIGGALSVWRRKLNASVSEGLTTTCAWTSTTTCGYRCVSSPSTRTGGDEPPQSVTTHARA